MIFEEFLLKNNLGDLRRNVVILYFKLFLVKLLRQNKS